MFAAVFVACISSIKTKTVNSVAFPVGPSGQLHVWFNLPEPMAFNACCESLAKAANEAQKNRPLNPNSLGAPSLSLAGEIRELQKLHESKVLTDAEFEQAKAKLLKVAGSIGFKQN